MLAVTSQTYFYWFQPQNSASALSAKENSFAFKRLIISRSGWGIASGRYTSGCNC